ncbi:hypothetical protein ACRRS0_19905 [Agarivorans sp. QJM3NY_29]|uniref:nucleotide-binding protein n=1 Tax=unclassified Agarivorans TaxID=2636026 RepID=UPI003D7C8282
MSSSLSIKTPIMFMACTGDAGKSFVCALICPYLSTQGLDVVPFKVQNMSHNAAVTDQGGEIGRA